jgi:glycosyltransferase involved in cell wall biosynthesis
MRKILLVANTDWYLYNFRLSLANYMREKGYETVLVSPSGRFVPKLQQQGFRWVEWKVGRKTLAPWTEVHAISKLASIFSMERPDLVHSFTVKPVLYSSFAARLAGISGIVSSVTGLGYVFLRQEAKPRSIRQVVKILYRLAFSPNRSAVIFENDADRQYFVREGLVPEERTRLIEGVGIDTDYFSLLPEPEGPPVVVLPARMLWDKGVGVLVEAARILHARTQVRVALVGEPDLGNPAAVEQSMLKRWSEEGVVEWWGWQEDMREVYRRSHIVTLPSLGEGVPTALLEAAACGRPIVATDVPGCKDIVIHGRNGLLVPANDPSALAEALERLLLDPELRTLMGAAGREIVLEKYTSARVNSATLQIYDNLLSEKD